MTTHVKAIMAGTLLASSAVFGPATPTAHAYPGDPMPGCETTPLGALICDGPIRPDGSWQRCGYKPGVGGMWPQTTCRIVTQENCRGPLDVDVPDHHIGG